MKDGSIKRRRARITKHILLCILIQLMHARMAKAMMPQL
jgi:hypothetical protein